MATGGNISRTLDYGNEPFYDFPCSLCEGEGKHMEAVKYCEECLVYLCDHCLRNKHNKFPLHKRHQLLDQSKFSSVNKSALVSFPTKPCQKHPGELINIFCGNHDVVCCSVCKALEHSNCAKTHHLPNAAKGIQTSEEYHSIKTGTRAFISDLDKIISEREADIFRIAKERQQVQQTIADFRNKINNYFDDLEKNSLAALDKRETTIVHDINKEKQDLELTKSKAEDILKQLEFFKGDNECDLFVQVKSGFQFLTDASEKLFDITRTYENPSVQFEIDRSIEKNITSLKTLGSFSSTNGDANQPLLVSVPHLASSASLFLPSTRKEPYQLTKHFTYKTKSCGKCYVKEKSDYDKCDIFSICQLPDDTFLVTDAGNKKLKRLDQSLNLIDSVQLSHSPHSACAVGPGLAAVSVCSNAKIQFLSLGNKLKLARTFTAGNFCRGIDSVGSELFVCSGDPFHPSSGCVEVYNNAGKLLRTIPQSLSSVSLYIAASDDGEHLFVTSFNSDIVAMLDLNGNVVDNFSHKHLKTPTGICTDGRGQLFVCGYKSNTVVQLSPKYKKIDVILREADKIKKPKGIWYDKELSRLLISCANSNEVLAFTLI